MIVFDMPLKAQLRRHLRKPLIAIANTIDPLYVDVYRVINRYPGAIPPLENRRRIGGGSIGKFIGAGLRCYLPIKEALATHLEPPACERVVLDFGAGVGRTLQYTAREFKHLHATDVDATAIAYLKRAFPDVVVSVNDYTPPLDYPGGFFDAIYSVSLWTHLPLRDQFMWLKELYRLVKPGGIVLITTHGLRGLASLRRKSEQWAGVSDAELEKYGTMYKEYPDFDTNIAHHPGVTSSYGMSAHSPAYIRRVWSRLFEVLEIREGVIDNVQDLVVLRKRDPRRMYQHRLESGRPRYALSD
ncbi:MAG: class I SAM-dependent methyltransferase [Rhodothermales bacterium]